MISLQAQELFARLIAKNESSCEKIIQFSLETASRRGLLGYTEELSMPLLYSALVQGILKANLFCGGLLTLGLCFFLKSCMYRKALQSL